MAPWSDKEECRKDHSFCVQLSEFYDENIALRARVAELEGERDGFRAEAMVLRTLVDVATPIDEPPVDLAPLTSAAAERQKAMEAVCEAAKGGCCNEEIDHDCDVRADCAWGAVCAALAALKEAPDA